MADEPLSLETPTEFSSVHRSIPAEADAGVFRVMGATKESEIAEKTAVFDETERRVESDRAYMADRMKAQGLEAEKLRPWDHETEQKKFQHSPIEAFGSFGSVVGILAAAFTRAPMENAFAASAAAMNAVKAGDDEGYKRAFESYKVNTDLVVKREQMIQNGFNDANALMRTDMAAGTAKAQNIATRYGDQQALFLLNNGMSKEYFELLSSRAKAVSDMAAADAKINDTSFREQTFKAMYAELPDDQKNNHARVMALFNYAHSMNTPEEERWAVQWWADPENKGKGFKEAAAAFSKYKQEQHAGGMMTPDRLDAKEIERRTEQYKKEGMQPQEAYDKAASEVRKIASANKLNVDQRWLEQFHDENPDATAAQTAEAFAKFKRDQKPAGAGGPGGNANLTPERIRAQAIAEYRDKLKSSVDPETGEPYSADKLGSLVAAYDKKLKTESAAPSGNQVDKLQGMINQTNYFENHMNAADKLLLKHNAITGLGGKLTRPAEAIGNIFGSNNTDRAQFRREVLGMQELAGRILTGSAGRPLAAEASKLEGIIAGLAAGDTQANTLRAYEELRPLLAKIKRDLETRKGGGVAPAGGSNGQTPAKEAPPPRWMNMPIISPAKRSDAGGSDDVAMRGNISDGVTTGTETLDIPPGEDPADFIRRTRRSGGGPVMSDASDDPMYGGQQYAAMDTRRDRGIRPEFEPGGGNAGGGRRWSRQEELQQHKLPMPEELKKVMPEWRDLSGKIQSGNITRNELDRLDELIKMIHRVVKGVVN